MTVYRYTIYGIEAVKKNKSFCVYIRAKAIVASELGR